MLEKTVRRSSPLLIALAWLIVVVPTGWGLTYTVQNALKIFTASSHPVLEPGPARVP